MNKVIHKRSSVITDGKPKLPSSDVLDYGELAINYADGMEVITLKNTSNEIIEFRSKEYVDNEINVLSGRVDGVENDYKSADDILKVELQGEIDASVQKLMTNTNLSFYCVEPVSVTINEETTEYSANSLVNVMLKDTDEFTITTTSDSSIQALYAWPKALDYFYPWLEGVFVFNGILFDMNSEDMYTKWNQGNQGVYHVQYAQYKNCVFWSDLGYISDVAKRTNYTLYNSSELPLCYSTIPENTFKSFYFAYNVTSDPNWSNQAYKDSFANATWATQAFSYYGLHSIGMFDVDSTRFNITLPKDCRGLMFSAPNILSAGVFDAINVTNFGSKQGSWRDAFAGCYQLQNLYIKNLKVSINISWSPISQQSLAFILEKAANTTNIVIYLSEYTYYRLTDANKTTASEKNITLSLIATNTTDDSRLRMLQTTGDGNSYLANDGTYKAITIPDVDLSGYYTKQEIDNKGYLTQHQDITGKQDVISDLATIRANAAKGATALQTVPSEYVTEMELANKNYVTSAYLIGELAKKSNTGHTHSEYLTEHQDISGKQDVISDLATIRSNAAKGATALQSVPSEYVTETELGNKNYATSSYVVGELAKKSNTGHTHSEYLTEHQDISGKQDVISDLATIRSGAALGATALQSVPSEYVTESELTSELNKKTVTKSYVDRQINAALTGNGIIPSYVMIGSERVAENVLRTRNAYSFVMGAISDLHTTGSDSSASGVEHACLAFNEINKLTQLDMIANLGDVMKGYMDDINDEGFKFVKQQMDVVAKSVPLLQLEGNHDDLSDLSTEEMKQKAFAYIGANNVNVVTDFNNRYRNYGYKDFDDLRFRVIYLNTTDCTEYEVTDNIRISPPQLSWLVNTATNFSNKTEPNTWHFIVLSHVPLNAQYESIAALQTILKAMVSKSSGTVSVEGTNISYNFGSLAQKLVCHIHGHIHNFRTEWFDNLLSITVPNACFERNNEYGMLHESETIRNIFGDVDKNGNQRQFNKTQASGEDTAFNVFVIDSRVNNKIYAYNYGAGINRTINLITKEVTESSYESIGGEILPDGVYINSIPLSTIIGGSEIYNDGLGYKNDTYISSSSGGDSSTVNHFATGVMHYPMQLNYTPDIYILGADVNLDDSYTRMGFYNESGLVRFVATNDISNYFEVVKLADKYYKLKVLYRGNDASGGQGMSNIGYNHGVISGVRISLPGTGEDVIVSIQNPIVSSIFEGIEWVEYTNQVPISQDTSGNIYNEGLGYKEDYRLGSSGGESTNTGSIISGFIPYNGEVIRAYGSTSFKADATGYYIIFYDSAFNTKLCVAATRTNSDPGVYFEEIDRRCVFTIDPSLSTASDLKSATNCPWFRVSLPLCSHHKFAVTLNEKLIVETETDE